MLARRWLVPHALPCTRHSSGGHSIGARRAGASPRATKPAGSPRLVSVRLVLHRSVRGHATRANQQTEPTCQLSPCKNTDRRQRPIRASPGSRSVPLQFIAVKQHTDNLLRFHTLRFSTPLRRPIFGFDSACATHNHTLTPSKPRIQGYAPCEPQVFPSLALPLACPI